MSPTRKSSARARKTSIELRIARALKDLRKRRKLSIEQLSERAGITVSRLEKFEAAERSPYIDELFALAQAFRIRPHTLARRMCDPPSAALIGRAARKAARS